MYIEDPAKVYGCYNCGEIMGDYVLADTGHFVCSHCGEPAVITFTTALDTMIKLQRKGFILQSDYYDEDDAEAEINFAELVELIPEDDDD